MDGRKRLAELFGEWADGRGLTQTDVAAMGGPSTTTQTKVRLTDEPISRQTIRQLEAVMGWPAGRAMAVLQGDYQEPSGSFTLADVSNEELLEEVAKRMRRGGTDASAAEAGKKIRDVATGRQVVEKDSMPRS